MSTGQVKWFNSAKGFGFILPDGGGDDLFAHYSSIAMDGYKTLKAGQFVSFDVLDGPKGPHAVNIVPAMDDAEGAEAEGAEKSGEGNGEGQEKSAAEPEAAADAEASEAAEASSSEGSAEPEQSPQPEESGADPQE